MSITNVCQKFDYFRKVFRDGLDDSNQYHFTNSLFKKYCLNEKCNNDLDKINAGCLYLFYEFFGKYGSSFDPRFYKDEAVSIMIWLGYILNLKSHEGITTLIDFYYKHIENDTSYTEDNIINQKHKNYKGIIDEIKEYMDINISYMSKFYELLKLLCEMNTAYTTNKSGDFSQHVNKFVEEYGKLFNDVDNNTDNSTYSKVLLVMSNYYNNFEKGRNFNSAEIKFPTLPKEKPAKKVSVEGSNATQTVGSSSGPDKSNIETATPISNTTLSESSLVNKLVIVLPILAAIPIFLVIAYKYSLFGFRKRSQKQQLREKLKK
ncbi:PIR protein [Plasmodium yoelii]|uniref:PIR protein n=2 Tax=Plasmodium yoelii TaxID=5861 RepID=A0AAE9WS05_PLAYO|nr:PIR protein [Plasmodium yoelii]WBY58915.1 PIR protein [Plasmodium yoelii yoelii]CDU19164.1 YIR protein [Plasmodium yoelii]VTZ79749.1 PIR protein [Plasmodium yoelii]|eukprot:XP_022812507.1 PIR protein [Plasmodium yoelii]